MTEKLFNKDLMFYLHLLTRLDVSSQYNEKLQKNFNALQKEKMNIDKTMFRINTFFKESFLPEQPNIILSREDKIKLFYNLDWIKAIKENDFGSMLEFIKTNDFQLLPDIPISHFVKDRNHQILSWYYILALCFISEIVLLEKNKSLIDEEIYNNKIKTTKELLLSVMRDRMEYEKEHKIFLIVDKEIMQAQNNKMTKEGIQEASNQVQTMFQSKGGKSGEMIGKIVNKLSSRLQNNVDDEDGINMFNIMDIAKDIAKEVASEINPNEINHAEIMNISKDIGRDMMNKISPEERSKLSSNPMMAEMMKAMDNPEHQLDVSSIEKLAKDQGINPEEIMKNMESGGGMASITNFLNTMTRK